MVDILVITKKDVEKILTPAAAIKAVHRAFKAYGMGQADMPPKSYLYFKKGDLRTMPAYIHGQGFDIAGVKSVNVHPENKRYKLPSVMAVITLTDPKSGQPLAVLDGTYLTSMRTGAAGAIAAKYLSKKNAKTAGFVGGGSQAYTQLACLMEVRKIKGIKVWQRSSKSNSAEKFGKWAKKVYGLSSTIHSDIDNVSDGVDVLITTTPTRKPLVTKVAPGTHINAIGADAEGKQEIEPSILKRARIVIDDWAQASHSGEINVPLKKRQISKKGIHGSLGEIAAGKIKGRISQREVTLFDSTGLAIQDISCAFTVYKALKDKKGTKRVNLF